MTVRTWARWWVPGVCKHEITRCIHGQEILDRMPVWRDWLPRQACLDCGRRLNRGLPPICWYTAQPHLSQVSPSGS